MADILADGVAWLAGKLKAYAAHSVVYSRGNDSVTVNATIGRTLLKLNDGYGGVRMQWTDRDYLIAADDLTLAGQKVLPQRGDEIRETRDGKVFVYQVLAPAGEPEWRWSDVHHTLFRIHTKQIGVE